MKKRKLIGGAAVVVLAGASALAMLTSPTIHSGNAGESPQLGSSGKYSIGTVSETFVLSNRSKITASSAITGALEQGDRSLSVRVWYPRNAGAQGMGAVYSHELVSLRISGNTPIEVKSQGHALSGADALLGESFPLVVMSHGFGGWNTQFSNLAEHIASHGYVVASIDHADHHASDVVGAMLSFGNVLVDRTLDQRQVLQQLLAKSDAADKGYAAQINPGKVALIGYSMGGYGALASAGAIYSFTNAPLSTIPEASQAFLKESSQAPARVDALIAFAPWGAQPDNRVWTQDALSKVTVPTLLVSGNQDDVVNFDEGVSWLFDHLTAAERYMLVYREARHNIVGNDFVLDSSAPFAAHESLREPVWRSDRLNSINQHFVTAFLDVHLKGDQAKAELLQVPTVDSNKSRWPLAMGEQLNGSFAGEEHAEHWPGFQRRWAVGLEFHHKASATETR